MPGLWVPETWHRDIVRRRWARRSRPGRPGRPPVRRDVGSVVVRLARENKSWGYRRIHGELAGPGIAVAPSAAWQILTDAGISPALWLTRKTPSDLGASLRNRTVDLLLTIGNSTTQYHQVRCPDLAEHRLPLAWTTTHRAAASHVLTLNLTLNLILNDGPRGGGRIVIMASEGPELHSSTSPPGRQALRKPTSWQVSCSSAHAEVSAFDRVAKSPGSHKFASHLTYAFESVN